MRVSRTTHRVGVFAAPWLVAASLASADSSVPSDLTAQAGVVGVLDAAVRGLVDDGVLPAPRGRSLLDALAREREAAEAGDTRRAAVQLEIYVHRVDALVRRGTLTAAQGQALAVPARAVADSVRDGARGRIAPTGSSGVVRGDFDHDGFGDLAVGAPNQTVDGAAEAGAVYVIYGTANGLAAAGARMWTQDAAAASPRGARFGSSLASGDFDGDGFTDLAVGAPGAADGAGRVDVMFGSASGLVEDRNEHLGAAEAGGGLAEGAGWNFGAALAWADFDGDGIGDLAVGVPGTDREVPRADAPAESVLVRHAGLVCIFFGSADGLLAPGGGPAATPQIVAPRGESVAAGPDPDAANAGDRFGSALVAGNFDTDRFADLAIAAPFAGVTLPTGAEGDVVPFPAQTTFLEAGRVHVLRGSAAGLDVAAALSFTEDAFLGPAVAGQPGRSDYGDRFGTSLAAGDFDGDGVEDLAIGAPYRDDVAAAGARVRDAGAVFVVSPSGAGGLATPRFAVLVQGGALGETREPDDRFGAALTAGDLDGDGRRDLVVGVPSEDLADLRGATLRDCGVVHVIYGTAAGPDGSRTQILRRSGDFGDAAIALGADVARRGDRFGSALTAWNFNGVPSPADLAVGVPFADADGRPDAGTVIVGYGAAGGLSGAGAQSWRPGKLGFHDVSRALFGATLY